MFCLLKHRRSRVKRCSLPARRPSRTVAQTWRRISYLNSSELQILKHAYRQERLSFTAQVVASECDYVLEGGVTAAAAQELLAAGKFSELEDLLANA